MDREALQEAVMSELARANAWDLEQWEPSRVEGVKLYEGNLPDPPEDADLSGVISPDVGDMVEAIIAQMQPAFSGISPITFEPAGAGDEAAADAETWFVYRELSRNGQDFVAITSALRDALVCRTCVFKVWIDEHKTVDTRDYRDVDPATASALLVSQDPTESRELLGELGERGADGNYKHFRCRITKTHQQLRVEAIAPEDFRKWSDWQFPTLSGCPFVAERHRYQRGELLSLGVPESLALQVPARFYVGDMTQTARRALPGAGLSSTDPMLEPVVIWRVYIRAEFEQGAEGETYTALWSEAAVKSSKATAGPGFFLTEPKEVPFHCYCSGVVLLESHRFLGKSAADKLRQTQYSKSEVLRQWLDNLAYLNNGRIIAVQGLANARQLADNNKPGGILDAKQKDAVQYIIGPDASQSALAALNYLDKARNEAGGASLDLQTSGQAGADTWRGTERQYTAKEMLSQLMLRTFSETGLRDVYLLAHRTLREYCIGNLTGKYRGEWIQAHPGQWPERELAEVTVGASGSAMTARVQSLTATLQEQLTALQQGQSGVLVDLPQVYQTLLALGRARGLEQIDRLWIDPASAGAQNAQRQKAQSAQAQQMAQAQFMEKMAAIQVALTAWEKRLDASVKYFEAVLKAEVEQMKVLGHSTTELERLQLEGLVAAATRAPAQSPAEEQALRLAGAGGGNGAAAPAAAPGMMDGGEDGDAAAPE